jgi:hypothetical protein
MTVKQRDELRKLVMNMLECGYNHGTTQRLLDRKIYDHFSEELEQWIMKQQLV